MTANQVVAHNLVRARLERGWTQDEARERIGNGWSAASYSVAERSAVRNGRVVRFDADLLTAMSQAFDVPVSYFFEEPQEFIRTRVELPE